ncbi:DUF1266 domain-containing protein [Aquabacterium sp. A7-Y]|uniref:DUF1266 domain-containing protein n=1 Tax=Aquabacterium sp. A7-Y TaxID=1349605 RepID=UPI00223E88AA|nr:DUF1266 domain-containing protein [Aquabacterium sp. A7-Y]MCW7537024.1 DUF1266 domain-containing protein [Aquabacterium sp. A7-Y]
MKPFPSRPRPLAAAAFLAACSTSARAAGPVPDWVGIGVMAGMLGLVSFAVGFHVRRLVRSLRRRRLDRRCPWPAAAWQGPGQALSARLLGFGAVMTANAGLAPERLQARLAQAAEKEGLQQWWGIVDGDSARKCIDDLIDAARAPQRGADAMLAVLNSGQPGSELQTWLDELYGRRGYLEAPDEEPPPFTAEEAAQSPRVPASCRGQAADLANFCLLERGCSTLAEARKHLAAAVQATARARDLVHDAFGAAAAGRCDTTAAYDLERAAYLARICCNLGYLHPREAWSCLQRAALAARRFPDWDTYLLSLLYGRGVWMGFNADEFAEALHRYKARRDNLWSRHPLPEVCATEWPLDFYAQDWGRDAALPYARAWAAASLCVDHLAVGELPRGRALLDVVAAMKDRPGEPPRIAGLHAWATKELRSALAAAGRLAEAQAACASLEALARHHPDSQQVARSLALAAAQMANDLSAQDDALSHIDAISALLATAERLARRFPRDPLCAAMASGIAADLALLSQQAGQWSGVRAVFRLAADMEALHPADAFVAGRFATVAAALQIGELSQGRLHKARDLYNQIAMVAHRHPGDAQLAAAHAGAAQRLARAYLHEELDSEAHEMRSVLAGIVGRHPADAGLSALELELDALFRGLADGGDEEPRAQLARNRALH